MILPLSLTIGVVIFAYLVYRLRSLTSSGFFMAMVVGISVAWTTGVFGLIIMGAFFVTATLVGRLFKNNTKEHSNVVVKGEERDALQVFANGGVPALFSVCYALFNDPLWLWMFIGSFAAVNADTWATSFGSLSRKKPFDIRTGKRVDTGVSGAISLSGTVGALLGSFLIATVSLFSFPLLEGELANGMIWLSVVTFSGFIAQFVDTLIGAWLQVSYRCRQCGITTEQTKHCGQTSEYVKGFMLIDNDVVNVICALSGALIALTFIYF
ncbi:DUF92 domain-containing protein [Texcoconibacillus texcoconensis]|uniref:Uncharacterized protein (TIGR00297 family) n=1 Tax=Texcoconibacillus texcoconensis TaxID=1095777 RepID=A0A840QP65_9BACI|nr:DUF92 domain-containing protein [Texcoconibacillus texcoconensis]MBB5173131.1 uncharacterized protein (TIGR00297 family) [Texcoconibacillus texcoconensis]